MTPASIMHKPAYLVFLERLASQVNDKAQELEIGKVNAVESQINDRTTCLELQFESDDDEVYPVYQMTVRVKYRDKDKMRDIVRLVNIDDNSIHTVVANPLTILQILTF